MGEVLGRSLRQCGQIFSAVRFTFIGLFTLTSCAAPPLPNAKPILEVGTVLGDGVMRGCTVGSVGHTVHPMPDMVRDAFFEALKQRGVAAERGSGEYVLLTRIDSLQVFCNEQLKQEGHIQLRFVVVAKPANTLVYQGSGHADLTGASAVGLLAPSHSIDQHRAVAVSDAQAARLQMAPSNANAPADIGEALIRDAVANAVDDPAFQASIQSLLHGTPQPH